MSNADPEFVERILRATIISATGEVLYDSEGNTAGLDNHANREEVRLALKNKQSAVSIRKSQTLNQKLMYYALYNQEQDNIIRILTACFTFFQSGQLCLGDLVTMIFAAILLIMIALTNLRNITKPYISWKRPRWRGRAIIPPEFRMFILIPAICGNCRWLLMKWPMPGRTATANRKKMLLI